MVEKPALDFQKETAALTRKSSKPSSRCDNTVAWNDKREEIRAASLPDRTWRAAQRFCEIAVCSRLPARNRGNLLPDPSLEWSAGRAQGQGEVKIRIGQISAQLPHRFIGEKAGRRYFGARLKITDRVKLIVIALHADTETRRGKNRLKGG
jgi:hypothetical protein